MNPRPRGRRIRALTAPQPIAPTSPCCRSARQPNPGRCSTYQRGKAVQTTGSRAKFAAAVVDIRSAAPRSVPATMESLRKANRLMPLWRNGRRGRLKICCSQGRGGSSPSRGTTKISSLTEATRNLLIDVIRCPSCKGGASDVRWRRADGRNAFVRAPGAARGERATLAGEL